MILLARIRAAGGQVLVEGDKVRLRGELPEALVDEARRSKAELVACMDPSPVAGRTRAEWLLAARYWRSQVAPLLALGDKRVEEAEALLLELEAATIESSSAAREFHALTWPRLRELMPLVLPRVFAELEGEQLEAAVVRVFSGARRPSPAEVEFLQHKGVAVKGGKAA